MSLSTNIGSQAEAVRAILSLVKPGLQDLETSLERLARTDDHILGPMLQTVLPGQGKRLRPALALLIGRLGQAEPGPLGHMALGVELLHTASLVHDDALSNLLRVGQKLTELYRHGCAGQISV